MDTRVGLFLGTALSGLLFSGCEPPTQAPVAQPTSAQENTPTVSAAEFADKSPAGLQQLLEDSTTAAQATAELLHTGVNYQIRLKSFRRQIDTAAAVSDALANHPQATIDQQVHARAAKVELLYAAAETDRATYEPRLAAEVQLLIASDPRGDTTALAEALLLELTTLRGTGTHKEKMGALQQFAKQHPQHRAGPALFVKYGEALEKANQVDKALACYRVAVDSFPDSSPLGDLRRRLARIEVAGRQRAAKQAEYRQRVASIKRKLGRERGYFVIYSFEKNKTMYRFEYDVLENADAAVDHILRIPGDWDWKLFAHFPLTSDGYAQAMKLREERVKKETAFQFPVFN